MAPDLDPPHSSPSPSLALERRGAHGDWLSWTSFEYRLPSGSESARRAIWRHLKAVRGVKLRLGAWAVPDSERGPQDLTPVLERVQTAGGQADVRAVGRSGLDDIERQALLLRACEAVWGPFFNDADRLSARASDTTAELAELDGLRQVFCAALVDDVVLSDAAERAIRRLRDLTARILDAHSPIEGSSRAGPRTLERRTSWRLVDGRVRTIVTPDPAPTAAWEQAFRHFETTVYRDDPSRAVLEHGAFVVVSEAAAVADELERLHSRLRVFAQAHR